MSLCRLWPGVLGRRAAVPADRAGAADRLPGAPLLPITGRRVGTVHRRAAVQHTGRAAAAAGRQPRHRTAPYRQGRPGVQVCLYAPLR